MFGRRIAMGFGLAAVMAASGCRCGGQAEGGVKEARSGVEEVEYRELEVEFTGCAASTRVPLSCELEDEATELRFWVAGTRHLPEVAVDGEVLDPVTPVDVVEEGHLAVVRVPTGARRLVVSAGPEANPGRWELELLTAEANPLLDEVMAGLPPEGSAEAREAHVAAASRLREALPSLTAAQQLEVRQRLYLLERPGRAFDEQLAVGQQLIEDALLGGRHETATHLARVMAFDLGRRGRLDEAERLLDLERAYSRQSADTQALSLAHYHRGALAARRHDARTVLVELRQALRGFRRLGLARREQHALALLIPRLGMLGKIVEQQEAQRRLQALIDQTPAQVRCDQAGHLNNAGWGALLSARRGDPATVARELLERALGLLEECGADSNPEWRSIKSEALINSAILATSEGTDEEAETILEQLSAREIHPRQQRWVTYLEAVVRDHRGERVEAKALLESLLGQDALRREDGLLAWRASVLLGELTERSGDLETALDAYLSAEQSLDRLVGAVGLDQGREGLLAGTYASSSRALRLLMDVGDEARAAKVAEEARTRAYRSLGTANPGARLGAEDRRKWAEHLAAYRAGVARLEELLAEEQTAAGDTADALRRRAAEVRESMLEHFRSAQVLAESVANDLGPKTPGKGELIIRVHPLDSSWIAFAIDDQGVRASTVQGEADESLSSVAATLLAEFAPFIHGARVVVVQAAGRFASVDLHAIEFEGAPLLFTLPVEYSFGAGGRLDGSAEGVGSALVVADPSTGSAGQLKSARLEGQQVTDALRRVGVQTELLEGDAADRATIQDALTRVDFFHFAGHGDVGEGDGWDSRLLLARGTNLDSRDILTLAATPETAVLLGCKTGYSGTTVAGNGMHLAAAFVLSGAERVVSASSDIPDEVSTMLAAHLYRDGELTTSNVAARLREAALELSKRGDESWASFRVVRP